MHHYYSQEGSRSLPESTRQTDCLFLVGPDIRASCWLWKCGFVIRIQKLTRKLSDLLFICLCLPDVAAATSCSSLSSREEM